MLPRSTLVACLLALGCGKPTNKCTGVCTTPHFSRLDLLAGQPGGPGWVDGTLTAAHFSDPWTFASDGQGHLYVADGETIRAIDIPGGKVTTLAGTFAVTGGTDGPGATATLNTPSGLAYTAGALIFTDTENHTVRKIDLSSGVVSTIAGVYRQPGTTDANGAAARFQEPEGIALDAAGKLYIADTDNNTIRVLALASGDVTTLAGSPKVTGSSDGLGAAASFAKPKAVALDGNGTLYVIDSINQSIRKVDTASGSVTTLAKLPQYAQGLAVVGSDVLVAQGDDTVVRVAADGTVSPFLGAPGMAGFVDATGADARLNGPAGLSADGNGNVWIADELNGAIRVASLASGAVTTLAGARSRGSSDGTGSAARFFAPQGLAADGDNLYVADSNNDLVRKIVIKSGAVTTIAGAPGQAGSSDGSGGAARFNDPGAVALDGNTLYVADTGNHALRRIDLAGGAVTTLVVSAAPGDPFSTLDAPAGLALDGGRLYVSDFSQNAIFAVDLAKRTVTTVAGMPGTPGGSDGVGVQARFLGPMGIASDGNGKLYVADSMDDDVRQIDLASGTVTTLAGTSQALGAADGVGAAAQFHYPSGITADGVGDLWVADTANSLVRHIDVKTRTVTTVVGSRAATGVRLGALPAQLGQAVTLTLTPGGALAIVSENSVLLAH